MYEYNSKAHTFLTASMKSWSQEKTWRDTQ